MEFGQYLRELRGAKGLTIRELDQRSGVSHSYISQLERGGRGIPSPEALRGISKALDVSFIGMMIKAGHITEEEVLIYRKQAGIYDLKGE